MSKPTTTVPPPPPAPRPRTDQERTEWLIHSICGKLVLGIDCQKRWFVYLHNGLRFGSILISSFAAVGLIADKPNATIGSDRGGVFWVSIVLLIFGIIMQAVKEFGVESRANMARNLDDQCRKYKVQLMNRAGAAKPLSELGILHDEVSRVIEESHSVLLTETDDLQAAAEKLANQTIARSRPNWEFDPIQPQKRTTKP
jgi:uncharacterized membrane protein